MCIKKIEIIILISIVNMCSICIKLIPDFGMEHSELICPVRNSQYCSYCAKIGHLTQMCPAKPTHREPTFLEQLLPPSDLKKYNITSKTQLRYIYEEPQQLLEIKDNDKVIMAYLLARSIKVQKGNTKRHTLEEYAKINNKRLVYIL